MQVGENKMSQQQSTVLNGTSGEVTMAFKDPPQPQQMAKPPENVTYQQPQQQAPPEYHQNRPPIQRIDSRSAVYPGPPNQPPQQRPPLQQQRPPPPGYQQQFVARGPPGINQQRPSQPPFPQQGPRPNFNPNLRPATPFPRPPQQSPVRPPGLVHQASVPSFPQQRAQPFNERAQTLTSSDLDLSKSNENAGMVRGGEEKPPAASLQNRTLNMSSNSFEHPPNNMEERRYSISSTGSVEGEKISRNETKNSRPESRADSVMEKIVEKEDSNKSRQPQKVEEIRKPEVVNGPPVTEKKELPQKPPPVKTEENKNVQKQESTEGRQSRNSDKSPKKETGKGANDNSVSAKKEEKQALNDERQKSSEIKKVSPRIDSGLKNRATPDLKIAPKSRPRSAKPEGDNDSGVDESTQGNEPSSNGDLSSRKSGRTSARASSTTPTKSRSSSRSLKSPNLKSPDSVNSDTPGSEKKKLPMNKIQVGSAPSPNLKVVKSKIGSLQNASHKPGGGNVKIENRKIEIKAAPRIAAKNETYTPGGGEKKIQQQKLHWNAKSKIGSLENAHHKPKGGDKKIESVKLDFKEKAKPKIGSKDNLKHQPGGGEVKIENRKLEIKAQSKIGSLDNVKHKPGGGDKKIFDDKEYLRQKSAMSNENSSLCGSQNSLPSQTDVREPVSDENLNREH